MTTSPKKPSIPCVLLALAAIVLSAISSRSVAAPQSADIEPGTEDGLIAYTRDVAASAGLDSLKQQEFNEGEAELRIWIGFGIFYPDHALRLRIEPSGRVSDGELRLYFDTESEPSDPLQQRYITKLLASCSSIKENQRHTICNIRFLEKPDWSSVLEQLEKNRVWSLPDDSELPKPDIIVFDGSGIAIEYRRGGEYRSYDYANPFRFGNHPDARAAENIMGIMSDLIDRSHDAQIVACLRAERKKWLSETSVDLKSKVALQYLKCFPETFDRFKTIFGYEEGASPTEASFGPLSMESDKHLSLFESTMEYSPEEYFRKLVTVAAIGFTSLQADAVNYLQYLQHREMAEHGNKVLSALDEMTHDQQKEYWRFFFSSGHAMFHEGRNIASYGWENPRGGAVCTDRSRPSCVVLGELIDEQDRE